MLPTPPPVVNVVVRCPEDVRCGDGDDDGCDCFDDEYFRAHEPHLSSHSSARLLWPYTPSLLRAFAARSPHSLIPSSTGTCCGPRSLFSTRLVRSLTASSCHALKSLDNLDQLHTIDMPTLIIVGADDPATTVAQSEGMHERIPNSQLVVIPDASHLSNVEQPAGFTAALLGFLNGL